MFSGDGRSHSWLVSAFIRDNDFSQDHTYYTTGIEHERAWLGSVAKIGFITEVKQVFILLKPRSTNNELAEQLNRNEVRCSSIIV